MTTGLLFNHDHVVAKALFDHHNQPYTTYDKCVGIVVKDVLVGAVLYHNWNGHNVELSYYGEKTMTPGVVRILARYAISIFDPSRLSVITSKRNSQLMRSLQRFGFKLEGASRCYYGKEDTRRNTGVRFVMFRERLDEVAKIHDHSKEVA